MNLRVCFALVLGLLAAAPALDGGEAKKKTDKERLQGTWRAVSGELRGKPDPKPERHTLTFAGDRFTLKRGDQVRAEGTFKLDPAKDPRHIDMTITEGPEEVKGKTALGIYHLKKGELHWCVAEPGDEERPKGFETEGTRHASIVLKREKKE